MTLKSFGRKTLAAVAGTGAILAMTSCGVSNTIDYLYVASSKNNPGQINVYRVDSLSGALTQIPNSPYPTIGRNPVGVVASPNGKNLYVINHDDNTLVEFGIGTDAKLYPGAQYTTPGSEPTAITISKDGTQLYVVDNYQPTFTDLNPGPGALVVYPINTDGSLGTPVPQTVGNQQLAYYPLENTPSAISALANGQAVFVAEQLTTTSSAACTTGGQGGLEALAITPGASGGAITPIAGSPFCAGVTLSSVATDPASRFLYVTDSAQNQLIGFTLVYASSSAGNTAAPPATIQPFVGGPIPAGTSPSNITIDPRGLYMYVTNFFSNSISGYAINTTTGIPSATAPGNYTVGAHPQCVIVEPALGRFAYITAFADNNVYGYQLNPNTGVLTGTQNSPYITSGQPTCLAAVTHGNHPVIEDPSAPAP